MNHLKRRPSWHPPPGPLFNLDAAHALSKSLHTDKAAIQTGHTAARHAWATLTHYADNYFNCVTIAGPQMTTLQDAKNQALAEFAALDYTLTAIGDLLAAFDHHINTLHEWKGLQKWQPAPTTTPSPTLPPLTPKCAPKSKPSPNNATS